MASELPPGFREVAPCVFEGPARRVGPDAYLGLAQEHVVEREVLPSPWTLPRTAEDYRAGRFG